MSVPIRCERLLAQLRYMARLHFVWYCSGERQGLRIIMGLALLPVLLFLLLTAAAAAIAAAAGDLLCRHLWPLHQRS